VDATETYSELHAKYITFYYETSAAYGLKKKVKQSLYTPWRRLGGEEV
jgi:hypothetical protein